MIEVNKFSQELGMIIRDMNAVNHEGRKDKAEGEKRVELHMHTNMSVMDATNSPSDLISQAAKWGHKAICDYRSCKFTGLSRSTWRW